jgi:hypothetical protein
MTNHYLRLVLPGPSDRPNIHTLARLALICASRRLHARGIDDPALVQSLADAAVAELLDTLPLHVHAGGSSLAGLLCTAIERSIERSTGQTGKAN